MSATHTQDRAAPPASLSHRNPPLDLFKFDDTQIRVVASGDKPWFLLADLCKVLDLPNASQAASRLDDDEKSDIIINDVAGRPNRFVLVDESGMYSLVMTSRRENAKRFKKWVTGEVLPEIRKTGSYRAPATPVLDLSDSAMVLRALEAQARLAIAATERAQYAEGRVEVLLPQAQALRLIAADENDVSITVAAKTLEFSPAKFITWLKTNGWIYRGAQAGAWTPYQDKINAGFMVVKFVQICGGEKPRYQSQALFTPKGIAKVSHLLSKGQGALELKNA